MNYFYHWQYGLILFSEITFADIIISSTSTLLYGIVICGVNDQRHCYDQMMCCNDVHDIDVESDVKFYLLTHFFKGRLHDI